MPSPLAESPDVTVLLQAWSTGDTIARDRLFDLIYAELHRIAEGQLSRSPVPMTLQATDLIHEAYFRLARQTGTAWSDRGHFYAISATVIRRVLLDHARYRLAARRDRRQEVGLGAADGIAMTSHRADELVRLDAALEELATVDPRRARIVELRYFGGLSTAEVAEIVGVSAVTVKRDWALARAWLRSRLEGVAATGGGLDG